MSERAVNGNDTDVDVSANPVAIIDEDVLRGKIYEIRGQKVMLDFELAEIYGYTTKAFNRQVKNNIEKFDGDDFMFRITRGELEDMVRCKKCTSPETNLFSGQGGGTRYLPYAFTEQGVYMLMTVLRGDLATRQSRALIRLFKQMKDHVEEGRWLVGQRNLLDFSKLVAEDFSETLKLRRELSKVEGEVASIVDEMSDFVRASEIGGIVEGFGSVMERHGYLLMDDRPLEAAAAYAEIYRSARHSIHIVDNYVGVRTLALLGEACDGVTATLFTDNRGGRLHEGDLSDFRREHPGVLLEVRSAGGFVHDRYIAIDLGHEDEVVLLCGSSSKDAGRRVTTIMRANDPGVFRPLFDRLLECPPLELG